MLLSGSRAAASNVSRISAFISLAFVSYFYSSLIEHCLVYTFFQSPFSVSKMEHFFLSVFQVLFLSNFLWFMS